MQVTASSISVQWRVAFKKDRMLKDAVPSIYPHGAPLQCDLRSKNTIWHSKLGKKIDERIRGIIICLKKSSVISKKPLSVRWALAYVWPMRGHNNLSLPTAFKCIQHCVKPGLKHPKGLCLYNKFGEDIPCINNCVEKECFLVLVWNLQPIFTTTLLNLK